MALPGNTDYQNPQTDTAASMPGAAQAASQAAPSFTPPAPVAGPESTTPETVSDYQAPASPKAVNPAQFEGLTNTIRNFNPNARVLNAPDQMPEMPAQSQAYQQAPQLTGTPSQPADSNAVTGIQNRPQYATVMDQNGRHHRYSKLEGRYIPVGNTDTAPLGKLIASAYLKHGKR